MGVLSNGNDRLTKTRDYFVTVDVACV